jgi:aquaporin NIP
MGSILASGTLALVLDVTPDAYFGTVPVGSNSQALVLEMISSFLLMFVISGVTTDSRAVCNPQIPQNFFSYVKNFIVC